MNGYGGRGPFTDNKKFLEKRPQRLKDYPGYLFRMIKGFFSRLFYVFKLIWDTKPIILVFMSVFSVATGVIPVLTAYVTRNIVNSLVDSYGNASFDYKQVALLIGCLFLYKFLTKSIR